MGKYRILGLATLTVAAMLLAVGASAATSAWFASSSSADKFAGDTLYVQAGGSFDLALWYASDFSHNVADFVVGYDTSNATKYGDNIGSPITHKLSLVSSTSNILATLDKSDTGWNGVTTAKMVSTRETTSPYIPGRMYGFDVIAMALTGSVRQGNNKFISFTMLNSMSVGDSSYVVISDAGIGASWTSALKAGSTASRPGEYGLKIVSVAPTAAVPEPSALLLGALGLPMIVSAIRRRK